MDVQATIEIRADCGVWADLRIVNGGRTPAHVHNPGTLRPTDGWEFSPEAYTVAVLRSFHFLETDLRAEDGSLVPQRDVVTRADHDVEPPIDLGPGAALTIRVPLHELYVLEVGKAYALVITYGDDRLRVRAEASFRCPALPQPS